MEAKHTPGPWYREEDGFIYGGDSDASCVADPQCSELDIDEREANAHLIAAAPDLLAALEEIDRIGEGALNKTGLSPALALRAIIDRAYGATIKAKGGA